MLFQKLHLPAFLLLNLCLRIVSLNPDGLSLLSLKSAADSGGGGTFSDWNENDATLCHWIYLEGATLLHYAVFAASSQMIKILLLYNVDINLQDKDGWTPLHLAVQSRRTDILRLLLIKGADKTLKNRDGFTALDLCLYSGRDTRTYELIKLLKRIY